MLCNELFTYFYELLHCMNYELNDTCCLIFGTQLLPKPQHRQQTLYCGKDSDIAFS